MLASVAMTFLAAPVTASDDDLGRSDRVSIVVASFEPINQESESIVVELASSLFHAFTQSPVVDVMTMVELVPDADCDDPDEDVRQPDIAVYAPKENFGVFGASLPGAFYPRVESLLHHMRYFDGAARESLEFGSPWPDANFEVLGETTEVAPGFHLIALNGRWGVDLEVVEISLAIETPVGLVLIIGCGHPTVERIVAAATAAADQPVYAILGGLHLLPAPTHEVRRVARTLRDEYGVRHVAPSHCTGEHAFEVFREVFQDDYVYAGLGEKMELPVADDR